MFIMHVEKHVYTTVACQNDMGLTPYIPHVTQSKAV